MSNLGCIRENELTGMVGVMKWGGQFQPIPGWSNVVSHNTDLVMDTLPRAADGSFYSTVLHFTNNWSQQSFPRFWLNKKKKSPPVVIKLKKGNVEISIKVELGLPLLGGYLLSADAWAHAELHLELARRAHGCSRYRRDTQEGQTGPILHKSHQPEADGQKVKFFGQRISPRR